MVAGGSRSSSATFAWTPAKQVSANSVILQTTIHLDQPSAVHMVANSSAMSAAARTFRTGFYNTADPNVVWTSSFRDLAVSANQWANFGTASAINLPAGDVTIYWKIWISGGPITLSSGTLLVEAFNAAGSTLNIATLSEPITLSDELSAEAAAERAPVVDTDGSGQSVTKASGG